MKVRSKSGLLAVLLSILCAVTLIAGIWLALPAQMSHADETAELVPLYGDELQNSGAPAVKEKGTVWDPTQMRVYFSFKGMARPNYADVNEGTALSQKLFNGDKFWITDGDDVTLTVAQWQAMGRVSWFAPFNVAQGAPGANALEFWLAVSQPDLNEEGTHPLTESNKEWLSKIKSVTILEGFQWYNPQSSPVEGAVVKNTVTLLNNGVSGWELSETNPQLTTDVSMTVACDNNVPILYAAGHMRICFNFAGNAPANVSAFGIHTLAGSKVADYIKIDGVLLSQLIANGEVGWVSTWGASYGSPVSRTLLIFFTEGAGVNRLSNNKEVTIMKGFTWVTRQAGAPESRWGDPDNYLENTNISLEQDVTIYNGGDKGWLSQKPGEEPAPAAKLEFLAQNDVQGNFIACNSQESPYFQKLGSYWSATQMRLFFRFGSTKLTGKNLGQHAYDNEENILITDSTGGAPKSLKKLVEEGRLVWADSFGGAVTVDGYGEIDFCIAEGAAKEENMAWLAGIRSVTVKKGFQWLDENGAPVDGAVVAEDITLYNGGPDKGWLTEDPNATVDNWREMAPVLRQGNTTWQGNSAIVINFTFASGKAPDYNNLIHVESLIQDYIKIDGVPLSERMNSYFDWVAIAQVYGGYTLVFDSQNTDFIASIKEVTLMKGFSYVVCDTPVSWTSTDSMGSYKLLDGAKLEKDITLYNGGEKGWMPRATELSVSVAEDYSIAPGESVDKAQLTVTATLKDGGTEVLAPEYFTIEHAAAEAGKPLTVTVKYQDITGTAEVQVTATQRTLQNITLDKNSIQVEQWTRPDLAQLIQVTAHFDDQSTKVLTPSEYTLDKPIDAWAQIGKQTIEISYDYQGTVQKVSLEVDLINNTSEKCLTFVPDATEHNTNFELSGRQCLTFQVAFTGIEGYPNPQRNSVSFERVTGSHMADYIQLVYDGETKTAAELLQSEVIASLGTSDSGRFIIWFTDGANRAKVTLVTFLAGFEWIGSIRDHWNDPNESADTINADSFFVPGAVLKSNVILWNGGNKGWQKGATSLTVNYTGGELTVGDHIDRAKLSVEATYYDATTATLGESDYTLDETGLNTPGTAQKVIVSYRGATAEFTVSVKAAGKSVTGIQLSATELSVRQFETPDFSSITITVSYSDSTTATVPLSDGNVTLSAYDTETKGDKQIKVEYSEFGTVNEQTLTLKVGDPDLTKGLTVAYGVGDTRWTNQQNVVDYQTSTFLRVHFKLAEGGVLPLVAPTADRNGEVNQLYELAKENWKTHILINGEEFEVWSQKLNWIAPFAQVNLFQDKEVFELTFCISEDAQKDANLQWLNGIQTIELKAGFRWYDLQGEVTGAVLKQDAFLWNTKSSAGWEKYAASIDVTTTQESLAINEEVDINRIKLTVHYQDGTQTEVLVTKEMLDRTSFAEAGESQKIIVTYQDKTNELGFTVTAKELTGIEIATQPTVKSYNFGALTLNLEGLAVNKVFKDNSKVALTADEIKTLEVTGFDGYTPGEQEITVKYGELTAKFKVTVKEPSETDGMYIDWQQNAPYDAAKQVSGVTITFVSRKGGATPKTTKVSKNADHLLDYVEINGKPAKQYVESGAIDWVGFYGWEFTIALKNSSLVWSTRAEGSENKDCVYEPGVSEVIKTVKILKGFQLYESKDGADHWLDSDEARYEKKKEGAVLTEDVYLYNNDGFSWERILKQDTGANVLEDNFKPVANALAITTPAEKLTYKKGEALSVRGLVLTALFEDGGTETITITANDVKGYKKDQVGRQTLTIEVLHGTITYEVEVTDQSGTDQPGTDQPGTDQPGTDQPGTDQPGADQPGKDEGGCGSVIGMNALLLMGGACAVVLFRRKRK